MGSFENVSSEGRFAEDERKLLELWQKLRAFERSVSQRADAPNCDDRPEFTRCVTSAMQGLRFAALDEDISVRVPDTLSPVQR